LPRLRRLRRLRLLAAGAVVLLAGALAAGSLLHSPDPDGAALGATPPAMRKPAPELAGEVLVPPAVRLAQLRGKPVMINFWASWCLPCRREAPALARFDRQLRARARLIGVDFNDAKSDALAFVRELHWRFPNLRDPRGKLGARYHLIGLPTTFVVDGQGRIAAQLVGAQSYAKLVRAIEALE